LLVVAFDRPVARPFNRVVDLAAFPFVVFEDPARDSSDLFGSGSRHNRDAIAVSDYDVAGHYKDVPYGDRLIVRFQPGSAWVNTPGSQERILIDGNPGHRHFVYVAADLVADEPAQAFPE
jgi:hypothetical protein